MSESPISLRDETGIERFRGTQSPGGGSQPGALRMLGPLVVTPADVQTGGSQPSLPLLVMPHGDWLLGFGFYVPTGWDDSGGNTGPLAIQDNTVRGSDVSAFSGAFVNLADAGYAPPVNPTIPGLAGEFGPGATFKTISGPNPSGVAMIDYINAEQSPNGFPWLSVPGADLVAWEPGSWNGDAANGEAWFYFFVATPDPLSAP